MKKKKKKEKKPQTNELRGRKYKKRKGTLFLFFFYTVRDSTLSFWHGRFFFFFYSIHTPSQPLFLQRVREGEVKEKKNNQYRRRNPIGRRETSPLARVPHGDGGIRVFFFFYVRAAVEKKKKTQ